MVHAADFDERLVSLAESIRRLGRSLLVTDVPPERLAKVEAEVDRLAAVLDSEPRDPARVRSTEWHLTASNAVEGKVNVAAPPLVMSVDRPGDVTGTVTLSSLAGGAPGRAHGGPVAAILDQALGRAVLAVGSTSLTMKLQIDYLKATPIGVPLDVSARCESVSGRALTVRGEIRNGDEVCASAVGLFLVPRENAAVVNEAVAQLEQAGVPQ